MSGPAANVPDVVVIGAGPVGYTLAAGLKSLGAELVRGHARLDGHRRGHGSDP